MSKPLDDKCREACEHNPSRCIPWFLCTSLLYYHHNVSVISDATFDWVCSHLLEHWSEAEHEHKHFISEDDLRAGSGYALPFDRLPARIKGAAQGMRKEAGL